MTDPTMAPDIQENTKVSEAVLEAAPALEKKSDKNDNKPVETALKPPKWWLLNAAIVLVLIISLGVFLFSHKAKPTSKPAVKSAPIQLAEYSHQPPQLAASIAQANSNALLTDLQTKLAMIEQKLTSQSNTQAQMQQYQDLKNLDQTLLRDEENNNQILTSSLNKDSQTILTQLDRLQTHLIALTNVLQKDKVTYLKPGALPFKVLAIDMIQQQPVVTLFYANDSFPISIDESVAGWQFIAADYTRQEAEFKNAQNEHVKIELQAQKGE